MITTVRSLATADLVHAVALDLQIFGGWWSWDSYQQELLRPHSSLIGLWLQPDKDGTPVNPCPGSPSLIGIGCLWRVVDEAHITMLGIHPQYRRRTLGQALLLSLLQTAQRHQAARATLEVRAVNTTAIALYAKFGFQTAGRRPHYYDHGDDALILWRGQLQSSSFLRSLHQWQQETQRRLAAWGCTKLQIDIA